MRSGRPPPDGGAIMKTRSTLTTALAPVVMLFAAQAQAGVLLSDSLQGSTTGVRSGGQFVAGGWKVTGAKDFIYWHLPHPISWGAVEFYASGLISRGPALPG